VPFFLPLVRHERRTPSGKSRSTERPLFPGYLFLSGDECDRWNAVRTGRLVGTPPITPSDMPGLLRDLSRLMDAIETGAGIGASQAPRPGDRVRVVSGMLEGHTGTLVRETHGGCSLLLHVDFIARVVEFEVEAWRCELIEGDRP
jgi:transcription antitermination factor NusG